MSRATKWKIEKAKVKVVFRLQFHATQIPQSGWEKLFISFIPTETGKATAKTSKAIVRNGTCKWADPIYETTRLLVDSKTKQYDDKLYKLVVGMGTSRSSILGEATLNLSDYADASQPAAIALPLHGSDHGTVLHVTVQLLTAKTGFREFEQQRDKGLQRETEPSAAKSPSSGSLTPEDLVNKVKTRIHIREETNLHEEYSDSQVTCDESSNASESYFADKNDSPSNHEKSDVSDHADMAIVFEENHRLRGSLEIAESSISELKMELSVLQNHANEMGTETQKFAQELASEIASSQELAKEVTVLKSECSKFKHDLQQLKEVKSNSKLIETEKTEDNKEIKRVSGVGFVEDKIREMQEKSLIGFREADLSFLNSDLEMLLGMVQDLKKETVEPESMLQFGEIPSVPVQEPDSEKAEKEILVKKMDQMESYYEALVQELEENQKRILGELETHKTEMNDLSAVNNELQKRSTISESALKRARLNYSIAVSQLQKDLDMLSFQVLSMFETNQTVIKESFPDNSQPVSKHISNDLKESLSLQENIYKKVEEELNEMCCANLCLDVYSGTLKETLVEASDHLRKTNKKLQELAQKLQLSNQSRDVLVEDVRALNGENTYYLAKCNDLHVQNQMLEKDLGNVSNENFLLMEKITECEALLMDYRVYKSKHEVVSGEKMSLEKELETLKSENDDMKRKFKNSLHDMVAKLEIPNESFDKLQMKLDSVANKFKSSLESKESHLENNEAVLTYLSSLELELQKVSSEDKNFHEQIMGLDMMIEEFEKSKLMVSELKQERQDLILKVESKNDEFSKVLTELGRLKESFRFVNDELDVERSTVTSLTLELKSQRSELDQVRKHASDRELENNEIQENMICDDLKLTFVKTQYETQIDELVKQLRVSCEQCRELEKKHLENETRYIKESESLQMKANDTEARLNDCMLSEARYTEENEKLSSELKSVRLELDASFAQNAVFLVSKAERDLEVGELKDMLTKSKAEIKQRDELQMKFEDTESRLKLCLENEARYIEENMKLSTELESVRFELETSIAQHAKISVSQYERDLEVGQLKDMLTKSNEEIEQYNELQMKLQMKLQDTESRLKVCLENEARYVEEKKILSMELESLQIKVNDTEARLNNLMLSEARCIEENKVLSTELESVRLELEASISQNAEISVSKNERDLEVGQMKDMLTKSKVEIEQYNERQMKFQETESRLICSLENEARYIEENKKLSTELESVKLELETSIAQNAEISVSKNEHAFEVGQLKDMLTTSKAEIEQYSDLQTKFQDTESRLNLCLENEARYIEENRNLATELESLQMKIKDTEARLNDCMSSEARYIEDNEKLSTELESVKLELEAFIAQNSVLRNECDIEVEQLKGMLSQSKAEMEQYSEIQTKLQDTESRLKLSLENEALYIDENRNLATEIESLKLELDASIAQNAEISVLKSKSDHEVGQLKDMLSKSNSEIELYNELQMKFQDTESRLKLSLENEARYIEENRNLVMELELVRLELKAFIAHNAEILESKDNNKDGSSISEKESEIVLVVLKAKLDEQNDELITLQNKCSELTNKLSEQILKTEEFKNMSIYLKELKDNADMAREKKEPEGPSESLRVAFIKEQYQAKLQEVKQQLTLSKKHNEEMLFKLQDALDEIENRKKSEASQLKRIQELEMEVDSVNSDKPGFDRIKAELECALLSLECCKEEKEKLVALLQECEDEKSKIAAEFFMVKEKRAQKEENGHTGANGSIDTKDEHSITSVDVRSTQEVTEREYQDGDNLSLNDSKQLMVVNDQFRTQHLRSCMEQLEEELEKMKNDNSPLPLTTYDPSFQDLQRELAQLNEANEELGSIYPNFVNFPGNGNALERVLALEIELAEALRSKKKPSIQFQSSFLKQHSDEEAVFKSFRDINELIKDMLEIKGKNVNVESELKEMHDRYSQLSLQFAEVEGERQKLMMTLKNVRSSRNLLRRSSMTALEDQTL